MFAVDTNIFIYAHFANYPQHKRARQFCEQTLFAGRDWGISWQVIYEYLRIVTHPRIHTNPQTIPEALADLEPYLRASESTLLTETPQHHQVLTEEIARTPLVRGNLSHDLHFATLLREHNVTRLYSADRDFLRFDFLDVIDPTRAG